jgi:hypothetical protein
MKIDDCVYKTKDGRCVSQRSIDQAIFEISSGKLLAGSGSEISMKRHEWIWHPKFKENIIYDLRAQGREPLEALTDFVESADAGSIAKDLHDWDKEMLDEQIDKFGDPVFEAYYDENGLLVQRDFNGMEVCEWTDISGYGENEFVEMRKAGTTVLKTCRVVDMENLLAKLDRETIRTKALSDLEVVEAMTEDLAYWGGEEEWVEEVGD